jgi:predicted O-linked N-acetylglucosamine transferase (SPINDLY family)
MADAQRAIDELLSLFAAGRHADMEARARQALAEGHDVPVVSELLGVALSAQQRHADALPFLQSAAERAPEQPQFWDNLALCQRQLGNTADAEASLRRSLALRPQAVETLNSLGHLLLTAGRLAEAEPALRDALTVNARHAGANFNVAKVLAGQGRHAEARPHLEIAAADNPGVALFQLELGLLLVDTDEWVRAEACLRAAVDLEPSNAYAWAVLARVRAYLGQRQAAIAAARAAEERLAAARVDPAMERHLSTILAEAFAEAGEVESALRIYKRLAGPQLPLSQALAAQFCARQLCDWDFAAAMEARVLDALRDGVAPPPLTPFPLLTMSAVSPAEFRAASVRYAAQSAAGIAEIARRPVSPSNRIRIGYLSGDFAGHAVGRLLIGVLEAHDRRRFEIVAYDYSSRSDAALRQRLTAAVDRVVPISALSLAEAAQRIAADDCDVAVDLGGWTALSRSAILAARPARVQMQWLGYPGTMGAAWIDYAVVDNVVAAPGAEAHFTEKLIRLPYCYLPDDPRRPLPQKRARSLDRLPESAFVFSSFNQAYKLTPALFDVWLDLLGEVGDGVLWLPQTRADVIARLQHHASARKVDAARLIFAPFVGYADHQSRLANADLALDCFPYGSHTTAIDTLWAGTPLVALKGETFASRVSASVLAAAGLPDLVTTSVDDYCGLVLRLARDRAGLREIRARVADGRASPLFDMVAFARGLETAYAAAVARNREGLAPDHIDVARLLAS